MDENAIRAGWKTGATCQIYSNSKKKWFQGEVAQIFTDEEGEWLEVREYLLFCNNLEENSYFDAIQIYII